MINYDWYYNEAWSIDVSQKEFGTSASIEDWEYLPDNDFLFLITDKSVLIKLKASTGQVLASIEQNQSSIPIGSNKISKVNFNSTLYVWNSKQTNNGNNIVSIDANTLKVKVNNIGTQTNSLFNILGLDVGYNLAITTTDTITDSNSTINTLKLQFVDDSNQNFSVSNGTVVSKDISLTPSTPLKNIYTNVFKRSDSTFIVLIFDKIFQVSLNKQDMSQSSITELNVNSSTNANNISLKPFSSAFISQNRSIFIKSNLDSKIYRIPSNSNEINTYIDLKNVASSTNSSLNIAANKNDENLFIYPVTNNPEKNSTFYLDNAIFIIDPKTELTTGLLNSNFLQDFQLTKPDVVVPDSSRPNFLSKIPSMVNSKDFTSQNAKPLLDKNVWLEANDLTGILKAKFMISKTAWYSTSQESVTIINKEFTVSKIYSNYSNNSKFTFATQTAFQNIEGGYFTKKSPSQLNSSDFDRYGSTVLPLSSSVALSFLQNLKRVFIITSSDDTTRKITVKAIVSYTNVYGNYVSFVVNAQTYQVTAVTSSSYSFAFTDVNSPTLSTLKENLPSLVNNTNIPLMEKFIAKEIVYPPSRRNIFLEADDKLGTLKVVVVYNGLDPKVDPFFSQVFTGFITDEKAKVKFNGTIISSTTNQLLAEKFPNAKDITTIQGYSGYDKKIVNQNNIGELSLTYDFTILAKMGFIPKVTIVPFSPEELEYGALTVEVSFDPNETTTGKKLPSPYKDKFGLTNYKVKQQYVGFLSVGVLYTISLKNYESMAVQNLVSTVPIGSVVQSNKLLETLNLKGFTLNEVVLTSYSWKNESIVFEVIAQSSQYKSINKRATFTIDWAPFFQSSRTTNLIIGVAVALLGAMLVASAIAFYIYRKNKIRRMLK